MNVLIAEDDLYIREGLAELLEQEGVFWFWPFGAFVFQWNKMVEC